MFSIFKKSISAKEFAEIIWETTRDWPAERGAEFKELFNGNFEKTIEDVFEEMVYFIGFSTDFALHCHLSKNPKVESAVRDAFASHLERFALDRQCKPPPSGNWVGDGLIWLPSDKKTELRKPLENLIQRFSFYGESIKRRKDKPAFQCLAHLLAGWCGNLDLAFIEYSARTSLGRFENIQKFLKSINLRA